MRLLSPFFAFVHAKKNLSGFWNKLAAQERLLVGLVVLN